MVINVMRQTGHFSPRAVLTEKEGHIISQHDFVIQRNTKSQ